MQQPGGVSSSSMMFCWICGRSVSSRNSQTDEHGNTVHCECRLARLKLKEAGSLVTATVIKRSKYDEIEELLQQAQDLREIANRLIERSDALIAAYKQLTGRGERLPMDH
jgi:hypothetical protein